MFFPVKIIKNGRRVRKQAQLLGAASGVNEFEVVLKLLGVGGEREEGI